MPVRIRHGFRRIPSRIADELRPFGPLLEKRVKENGGGIRPVTFIRHNQQKLVLSAAQQSLERDRRRLLPVRSFARLLAIDVKLESVVRADNRLREVGCGGEIEPLAQGHFPARGHRTGIGPDPTCLTGNRRARCGRSTGHLGIELAGRGAANLPDGIGEFLGGESFRPRAVIDVSGLNGCLAEQLRLRLIGLGETNQAHRLLQVVFVPGQMHCEIVQQVLIPRWRLHCVHWMDDAATHEPLPDAVGDRARRAAVLRVGDQRGELLQAFGFRQGWIDGSKFGKQPAWDGRFARRFVATEHFQRLVRKDRSQSIGFAELPTVHEGIVAGRALQVDAEKGLAHRLGILHRRDLRR